MYAKGAHEWWKNTPLKYRKTSKSNIVDNAMLYVVFGAVLKFYSATRSRPLKRHSKIFYELCSFFFQFVSYHGILLNKMYNKSIIFYVYCLFVSELNAEGKKRKKIFLLRALDRCFRMSIFSVGQWTWKIMISVFSIIIVTPITHQPAQFFIPYLNNNT